jgi:hypothetical protein
MAVITSYATLQTAISDWLARSDLTTFLPNFTQNWEEDFYREPLNWGSWMETALSVSISSGVAAVPSDYLGLKVAYISGQTSAPLKRISLDQLYQRYPRSLGNGQAVYIARDGANFVFGPEASDGTLAGTYYAKPTVLRTDADGANWLTANAPDLCLYGSLLAAEPFIKNDARVSLWQAMYDRALVSYRNRFKEEDYSGSPPHTVAV